MYRASSIVICLAAVTTPALAEKLHYLGTAGPQSAEYWIDLDSAKDSTQPGNRHVEAVYWIKFPNVIEHREGGGEPLKYNRLKEGLVFDCERPSARVFGSSEAWLDDKKI